MYFTRVSATSSQRLLGRPLLALSQCAGDGNLDEKLVMPAAASALQCPKSTALHSVAYLVSIVGKSMCKPLGLGPCRSLEAFFLALFFPSCFR